MEHGLTDNGVGVKSSIGLMGYSVCMIDALPLDKHDAFANEYRVKDLLMPARAYVSWIHVYPMPENFQSFQGKDRSKPVQPQTIKTPPIAAPVNLGPEKYT